MMVRSEAYIKIKSTVHSSSFRHKSYLRYLIDSRLLAGVRIVRVLLL